MGKIKKVTDKEFKDLFAGVEGKDTQKGKAKCKGLLYRGHVNVYVNSRGEYVRQEKMSLLKRKSCKCARCDYMLDTLSEFTACLGFLPAIQDIEHGALYTLEIVNEQVDWETGIVDDFDLQFVKVRGED